ncbi:Ig-like domain-containing protein, partial [Candidatus Peregrinibacteria bacterium]|nr:Ig-like domain-containing protein [Candidatus Peregrinibacteria bacterium]
ATATGEPSDGDTYMSVDVFVRRTFDANLNANTVNTTNVTLKANTGNTQLGAPAGANLCESVMLDSDTMIICEHLSDMQPLTTSTWYTFAISTGVESAEGMPLASNLTYSFQTGESTPDFNNTPPFIQYTVPSSGGENDFPINGNLGVEFSQAMNITGVGSVTSSDNITLETALNGQGSGTNICASDGCEFSWDSTNNRLTVNPASNLTASTQYLFTVESTAASENNIGFFSNYEIFFTTAAGADSTAPLLSYMQPASSTTGVTLSMPEIVLSFSEGLDNSTINQTNVKVFTDNNTDAVIDGGEQWANASTSPQYQGADNSIHIGLNTILPQNKQICIQLTTGVTDTVGTALASTVTRCFSTIDEAFSATAPTVMFASADNYGIWIEFDMPIDPTLAVTKDNYNIQNPIGSQVNLANATLTYRPEMRAVEVTGVGLQTDQEFKVTVTGIKDMSGTETIVNNGVSNVAQGVVFDSDTTNGYLGGNDRPDFYEGTDYAAYAMQPEMCAPRSRTVGVTSTVECEFPAPANLAAGSRFIITFPAGFVLTNATVPATTTSYLNRDINGPASNIPLIDAIVTNTIANTITVSTTNATILQNEQIMFELANIVNPSTAGQKQLSIVVKDESNIIRGQTINPAPFTIGDAGALSLSGTICKGASSGGTCDVAGDDTAVADATVFLDSQGSYGAGGKMGGHMEATTDSNGDFTFSGITSGEYGLGMFIDPSNSNFDGTGGGGGHINIQVTSTNFINADFKLTDMVSTGSGVTLTVNVTGGPASEEVDVFCFAPGNYQYSQPIMNNLTLDGGGEGSTTLTVNKNINYECSMGPHIPFDSFSSGGPPPMPDFTFMPPQPQVVNVLEADLATAFALETAGSQILGKVVDGSGTGIPNVFVDAFPPFGGVEDDGSHKDMHGSFTQTKSDGTFNLNVVNGTYEVGSCAPGMPCTTPFEVTVKDDTSNVGTDSNATADVYSEGTLVTGIGLTLTMAKSDVTISGQLQDENENAIKYGFVDAQKISSGGTCTSFTPAGGFSGSPTDSSGNYTLYVSNGTWRVSGFAPSYGEVGCSV